MTQSTQARRRRIIRQHLETTRLLGVSDVPVIRRRDLDPRDAAETTADVVDVPAPPPSRPRGDKTAQLHELQQRHDSTCPHCTTATSHTQTVFGEGDPDADLMFVGEAPGAEEDRTGRPFVGRAGQKLEEIIKAMGLSRREVYIANVLKSRPPENRTPLQGEVDACGPFLQEQIHIIQPKVIVTLGGPATKLMLRTDTGITRLRGIWAAYHDTLSFPAVEIPVMPTFHPAYLLRAYTVENRQKVWSDMQQVMKRLGM
jgi:uracil-DNA glycosylase family 4